MNIPQLQAPDMAAPIRAATAGAQQAVGQIVEGATKFVETGKQQEDRNNFAKAIFSNLDQINGGQKGKWWKQYDVNNIKPGQEKEIADIAQQIAMTAQWKEQLPPEQKQALAAPLDVNFMFNKYYTSADHQKSLQNVIQGGINKGYDTKFNDLLSQGKNSAEISAQMPTEGVTALKSKFDILSKVEERKQKEVDAQRRSDMQKAIFDLKKIQVANDDKHKKAEEQIKTTAIHSPEKAQKQYEKLAREQEALAQKWYGMINNIQAPLDSASQEEVKGNYEAAMAEVQRYKALSTGGMPSASSNGVGNQLRQKYNY